MMLLAVYSPLGPGLEFGSFMPLALNACRYYLTVIEILPTTGKSRCAFSQPSNQPEARIAALPMLL
jgi:hypothetical protein